MQRPLICYDFDGTLYPGNDWDSENYSLVLASQGTDYEDELRDYAYKDQHGLLPCGSLIPLYKKYIVGQSRDIFDKAAEYEYRHAGPVYCDSLKRLKCCTQVVVSCGVCYLAEKYLKLQGLDNLFSEYHAKTFYFDENGIITGFTVEVPRPEDKVTCVERLKAKYKPSSTICVGDGPTDIPMLMNADLGIIVDPNKRYGVSPDKKIVLVRNLDESTEVIERFLEMNQS